MTLSLSLSHTPGMASRSAAICERRAAREKRREAMMREKAKKLAQEEEEKKRAEQAAREAQLQKRREERRLAKQVRTVNKKVVARSMYLPSPMLILNGKNL